MAKIKSVVLESIPDEIIVNDALSDFTVITSIAFHPVDIKMEMEYSLHLFVYDVNGALDIPVIINNWDETTIRAVSDGKKDDFLGTSQQVVKASSKDVVIKTQLSLKLGKLSTHSSSYKRALGVYATIIPAVARASKWSQPFESTIVF